MARPDTDIGWYDRLRHIFAVSSEANLPEDRIQDIVVLRVLLLLAFIFILLFWILYRITNAPVVEPFWARALFALLPASLFGGSYLIPAVRSHLVVLSRGFLYLVIAWATLLAYLNEWVPSASIGLLVLVGAASAGFGIGLRRQRPLVLFMSWCVVLPGGVLFLSESPGVGRVFYLSALLSLVGIVYVSLERRVGVERARKRERDRLVTLFQSLPTPVVRGEAEDDAFIVREVNPAFERVFGWDERTVRGKDLHSLIVSDEEAEKAQEVLQKAIDEHSAQAEVRRMTDDEVRDFQLQMVVQEQDDGPPDIYATFTDITTQKKHEKRLRAAKEEAEEAARLKSAMLANMNHEVRTPLTSINGFSEILKEELSGSHAQIAERVHRSGTRLLETVDSVLQLSRLEAGAHALDQEPVQLDTAAEEAVSLLRPRAEEKSIHVEVVAPTGPVEISSNRGAVDRILTNLLENGIKFTPEGGRVTVCVWADEEAAHLEVEDTGVGIMEEALPDIFEAFKQESEGLGREFEGTGLGLSIVRHLTEALGGEIDVETEKGEGTRFTVRLPHSLAKQTHPRRADV